MIKKVKIFILLAVLSILFSNYQVTYVLAEETGNTREEAISLPINKTKTDYVSSESGERWFRLNVEQESLLELTLKSSGLKQYGMLYLYYDVNDLSKFQPVRLLYEESKKTQEVNLNSETILKKGEYLIKFQTNKETLEKDVKYTIKAKMEVKNYDDDEPQNDHVEGAQTLKVKHISKKAQTLNMHVSSNELYQSRPDKIDNFKITLTPAALCPQ